MNKVDKTMDLFPKPMNCSQALLTVFGETYGLDFPTAMRLGRPLGGGMGCMAGTCGAVSAAVLILGLAGEDDHEAEARKASFVAVQEFFKRFHAVHGATDCRNLLGVDRSTDEGEKKFHQEKLVQTLCPSFVRSAAGILQEMLES